MRILDFHLDCGDRSSGLKSAAECFVPRICNWAHDLDKRRCEMLLPPGPTDDPDLYPQPPGAHSCGTSLETGDSLNYRCQISV